MMRIQAPVGLTSFAHQGHRIELDGDGVAMIDERHFGDFEAHGFRPARLVSAPVAVEQVLADGDGPADPRRAAAIARLADLPTDVLEMLGDVAEGNLRVVTQDDAAPADDVRDPAPAVVPSIPTVGKLTDAQIDGMTKAQMTAWLKERDVPVIPPIDAETLRAKVRHANGG